MGLMTHIDQIAHEIADIIPVNPDSVGLNEAPDGWFADVPYQGDFLKGEVKQDPIEAMESLREAARKVNS